MNGAEWDFKPQNEAFGKAVGNNNMSLAKERNRKKMIREMVNRIVEHFDPERIILFGSYARDEAGPDSDVDLLVVMPVKGSKREKQLEIRALLHGIHLAKDIVVSRPEDFDWRKDIVGTIEYPATKEGKVLYARDREGPHRRRRVGSKS
jgi:predicted nucleotidyltransferase